MKQLLFLITALMLTNFSQNVAAQKTSENVENNSKEAKNQSSATFVELETNVGTMKLKLYDNTPGHRDNFIKLVEQGTYDSVLFHRVIPNFMIQGGDPDSKGAPAGKMLGMGGPGYTVPAEFVDENIHVKGALAAARMGDQANPTKASSGSQFYIVQGQSLSDAMLDQMEGMKKFKYSPEQRALYKEKGGTPFLDREYTVFGELSEGFDVLDKIAALTRDRSDRPTEDVIIIKATVIK
jgi:cyclophilin family peptidyl-prolyl cis-trans isomerase